MIKKSLPFFAASFLIISPLMNSAAFATRIHLGSYKDWDAFVQKLSDGTKICYMTAMPKSKLPERLAHGKPFLTVTHRPALKIKNEINIVVGYNFKEGSAVKVTVDKSRSYYLFTNGSGAWAETSGLDTVISSAMKRGSNVMVRGTSGRGNATSYRFSLSGFTAAHNAITKSCR
jgi:hypothetical protein